MDEAQIICTQKCAEDRRAYLQMIQGVISRMGGNLFYLKGWTITIIAAVSIIAVQTENPIFLFVGMAFMFVFWFFDAYFLSLERKYRCLFDTVREMTNDEIEEAKFSMNITSYGKIAANTIIYCMFSSTLRYFYGSLLFIISAAYLIQLIINFNL